LPHTDACARSRTAVTQCDCSCLGSLHGIANRGAPTADIPNIPRVPYAPPTPPRKRKARRAAAITAVVAATATIGGLTITETFDTGSGGGSGATLSTQVNVDLNKAISTLSALQFGGKLVSSTGAPESSQSSSCAANSTGQVQQFFSHYSCEEYTADEWTITRQGSTTQVAFGWVEMPSSSLAAQYKAIVDAYGTGNPPGVSSAFNGKCYASGQQDSTVWTVEVKPTGHVGGDRTILQAAAQQQLSSAYLGSHCVS
jgi:hypothetical protein